MNKRGRPREAKRIKADMEKEERREARRRKRMDKFIREHVRGGSWTPPPDWNGNK